MPPPSVAPDLVSPRVPLWQAVGLGACAGGLGWGIRGQYGHETGAMIAGVLVSLALALLFCRQGPSLPVARAVALGTIAFGFGGSETYAQTVGLTHDAGLVGNVGALRWGLLGLAMKGGLWIGFGGAFLGAGLSGLRYRPGEWLGLMLAMIGLYFAGTSWLNTPFDPSHRLLPAVYFSADWHWLPDAVLKPRRESWGGLLGALVLALIYLGAVRRDRLALRLGLWGILGGAVGFPLGQCVQAYHAWHLDSFKSGAWAHWDPIINWWNMMETTFGAVMGAALGLGLWLNRARIQLRSEEVAAKKGWPWPVDAAVLAAHIEFLIADEFWPVPWIHRFYDLGLVMAILPLVAVAGSRRWPYALIFGVTGFPIAAKTIRQLVVEEHALAPGIGWICYGVVPLAAMIAAAVWHGRRALVDGSARTFTRGSLPLLAWFYYFLNHAFFHYPWPWETWTYRTANDLIYFVCALALTWAAGRLAGPGEKRSAAAETSCATPVRAGNGTVVQIP